MSGLPETPLFEEEIYQIKATDFASGGPDGHPNISLRQLASRTLWLRRFAQQSQLGPFVLRDDDGEPHHVIYVPRFTVPAHALGQNRPASDLHLGGFLVDQFVSAILDSGRLVSRPMTTPVDGLYEMSEAREGAARPFSGPAHTSRLMSLTEWGHLAWLVEILGRLTEMRGPCGSNRDPRDPDEWAFKAPVSGGISILNGVGPDSWYHSGRPDGLWGLLGPLRHRLEVSPLESGRVEFGTLVIPHSALLAEEIDDTETTFAISSPAGFDLWPASDGLIEVDSGLNYELMTYAALVVDALDPTRAALTGVVRNWGVGSGVGVAHGLGVECVNLVRHCIIPDGWTARCVGGGLNSLADPVTFNLDLREFGFGTRDTIPAVGQTIVVVDSLGGFEDLEITGVAGAAVTASRGANGTTPVAHTQVEPVVCAYSPNMTRLEAGVMRGVQLGALRTHADLMPLRIPLAVAASGAEHAPGFTLDVGSANVMRGGHINLGRATTVDELWIGALGRYGYRCVCDLAI